jgi:hypothetical protein
VSSSGHVRTCNVPRGCRKAGIWSLAKLLLDFQEKGCFFESAYVMMTVLTWTTLSDVNRDDSVSSSDDIFIIYVSFLSLFLLLRC